MAYLAAEAAFGRTRSHPTTEASGVSSVLETTSKVLIGLSSSSIVERLGRKNSEWLPEMEYFGEVEVAYHISDAPVVRQARRLTGRGIIFPNCSSHELIQIL